MNINVSIIVPIYNVEKYLAKCIESIQNQTLNNIEIILVDDGTPDNSGKIADYYASIDKRIKVIHKLNGGLSSARNAGMKIAQGEYISFIDSDDWIERDMVEQMYNKAKTTNADIVVAGAIVDYTIDKRSIVNDFGADVIEDDKNKLGQLYWQLHVKKLSNYAWNKIYNRKLLEEKKLLFLESSEPAEDLFFNLSAFKIVNSVAVMNEAYYHYMKNDEDSILSRYQKKLIDVEHRRNKAYVSFFEHFSLNGNEQIKFLNSLPIGASFGIVTNLYKKGATFSKKEKRKIIDQYVFKDKALMIVLANYKPNNAYQAIFSFLAKHSSPWFFETSLSFLFFLRNNFINTYLKFRKRQLTI